MALKVEYETEFGITCDYAYCAIDEAYMLKATESMLMNKRHHQSVVSMVNLNWTRLTPKLSITYSSSVTYTWRPKMASLMLWIARVRTPYSQSSARSVSTQDPLRHPQSYFIPCVFEYLCHTPDEHLAGSKWSSHITPPSSFHASAAQRILSSECCEESRTSLWELWTRPRLDGTIHI